MLETVRQAARAGQFYPGEPAAMNQAVDAFLAAGAPAPVVGRTRRPARAIMLPHAGWVFCGKTIGKTLGQVLVPDLVVIIGPRHTPYGPQWSIASHERWEVPGSAVPIATDLVARLAELVPELVCEPEAHRFEHGSEVLLPFLQRLNTKLRVVPVVLGQADYAQTTRLAAAVARVVEETNQPTLLVISSDMNHFAPEPENRRLDLLALEAMCTGKPEQLARAVAENRISMCGVIPALVIMQALQLRTPRIVPELVDYCNSAAASGDARRVVGYGGVVIE